MKNRDLIKLLLDKPLDSDVCVGKGMGPLEKVANEVVGDKVYIVVSP